MRLAECLNALEAQHRLFAEQIKNKSIEIYETNYLDQFNIVAFFTMNPLHMVRTVCFIFVQIKPGGGGNDYFVIVQSMSAAGIARHFWLNDELVDTYTDNNIPLFTFIGSVNNVKSTYSDLVATNDYPATVYKAFAADAIQAENEFLLMSGIPFKFMSGQTFKFARAL